MNSERFGPRRIGLAVAAAPALALLLSQLLPGSAHSLPLFSRERRTPCVECHLASSRLNAAGMAFLQNGYRGRGEKGAAPWHGHVLPLGIGANAAFSAERGGMEQPPGARKRSSTQSAEEHALELNSMGTLAPSISYALRFDRPDSGKGLERSTAFVQLDDLGRNGTLNVRAGVWNAEIPYLSDARRTSLHRYLTPVTIDARGVELNGQESSWPMQRVSRPARSISSRIPISP